MPASHKNVRIVPVSLGKSGMDFMCRELAQGGPLSRLLSSQLFEAGDCFAPLPGDTDESRAHEFRCGGIMSMGAAHQWMGDCFAHDVLRGQSGQIVFEETWIKKDDSRKKPPQGPFFHIGDTPYFFSQEKDYHASLDEGMRRMRSFLAIGFVTSPPMSLPTEGGTLDAVEAAQLALCVKAIFVSAYDQESYVIWARVSP